VGPALASRAAAGGRRARGAREALGQRGVVADERGGQAVQRRQHVRHAPAQAAQAGQARALPPPAAAAAARRHGRPACSPRPQRAVERRAAPARVRGRGRAVCARAGRRAGALPRRRRLVVGVKALQQALRALVVRRVLHGGPGRRARYARSDRSGVKRPRHGMQHEDGARQGRRYLGALPLWHRRAPAPRPPHARPRHGQHTGGIFCDARCSCKQHPPALLAGSQQGRKLGRAGSYSGRTCPPLLPQHQ